MQGGTREKMKITILNGNPDADNAAFDDYLTNGLWAFFILTYALMLLTWGIMAVFQMRAAAATDTGAPPSAFGMVLFLLGGCCQSPCRRGKVVSSDQPRCGIGCDQLCAHHAL
jgi:hypothetical protein